jgi:hypothetical protein
MTSSEAHERYFLFLELVAGFDRLLATKEFLVLLPFAEIAIGITIGRRWGKITQLSLAMMDEVNPCQLISSCILPFGIEPLGYRLTKLRGRIRLRSKSALCWETGGRVPPYRVWNNFDGFFKHIGCTLKLDQRLSALKRLEFISRSESGS